VVSSSAEVAQQVSKLAVPAHLPWNPLLALGTPGRAPGTAQANAAPLQLPSPRWDFRDGKFAAQCRELLQGPASGVFTGERW